MTMNLEVAAKGCLDRIRKIEKAEKVAFYQAVRRTAWNIKRKMVAAVTGNKRIMQNGELGGKDSMPAFSDLRKDAMQYAGKKPGGVWGKSARVLISGRNSKDVAATIGYPAKIKPFAERWQTPGYQLDAMLAAYKIATIQGNTGKRVTIWDTMNDERIRYAFAWAARNGGKDRIDFQRGYPPAQPVQPEREVIGGNLERYADRAVRRMVDDMLERYL